MGLNCAHAVHCITEAVRRLAAAGEAPYASEWLFDRESPLGKLMLADIAAGDYETAQQEAAEREPDGSGGYDFQTAVNEWVHQWCAATSATRSDIPAPFPLTILLHAPSQQAAARFRRRVASNRSLVCLHAVSLGWVAGCVTTQGMLRY
jgi:hypothetical protein